MLASFDAVPMVSVIIPVFNGEKYLRESLDSIVNQTYPNIEILVMDDASTDSTSEIIADYGEKVGSIRQPQNKGQFGNVNDGIARSKGKYTAIYHADDIYDSKIVENEVGFLEKNTACGAVFCYDIFVNAEGCEYGRLTVPDEFRTKSCFDYKTILNGILRYKNRFLPTPGAMVRTAVYQELGTFRGEEYQIASDLDMWLRIARKHDIGILHQYLFSYRHGHENSSQVYYRLRTEEERHFLILDEHLANGGSDLAMPETLAAHKAHRAEDNLMVAINHYIVGNNSEARKVLSKVDAGRIFASPVVQRGRLLLLLSVLHVLLRIPRIQFFADMFYRRWHVKEYV